MITKVYLVRHAEAAGNVAKTFQGHTDCEVTEKGHKQLACLAERFKDVHLDIIYSSPLLRTRQTAAAVNKYHGLDVHINQGLIIAFDSLGISRVHDIHSGIIRCPISMFYWFPIISV